MIRSFKGKFAEAILADRRIPKGVSQAHAKVPRRKLDQLYNAVMLADLACRPETNLKLSSAIWPGSIRFGSTTSGELFSSGPRLVRKTWKSWITIRMAQMRKKLAPVHPGEVLREDFLRPMK